MKNKKIIICIVVVVVLIAIIAGVFVLNSNKITRNTNSIEASNSQENEVIEENENEDKNEVDNETEENAVDNNENEEQKPEVIEPIEEQYTGEEEKQSSSNNTQNEKSEEETIIDLVKQAYGNTNDVTFGIAHREGENCIVSVVDENGAVLQWYTVNVNTKEVSLYQ